MNEWQVHRAFTFKTKYTITEGKTVEEEKILLKYYRIKSSTISISIGLFHKTTKKHLFVYRLYKFYNI